MLKLGKENAKRPKHFERDNDVDDLVEHCDDEVDDPAKADHQPVARCGNGKHVKGVHVNHGVLN